MFGEEDWDAETSSTAVTTNYRSNNENSFSPKSPIDTSKRSTIGRGRGKFSPISGQYNQNQGQYNQNQSSGQYNQNQSSGQYNQNQSSGFGDYKPRNSKCFKCGNEGHISRDCPSGGGGSNGFSNNDQGGFGGYKPRSTKCYKCGEEGHMSRDCTSGGMNGSSNNDQGFGGSYKPRSNKCYKCGEEGHISRDCPGGGGGSNGFSNNDQGSGFNSFKPRSSKCYKCGEEGHISRDCPGDDNSGGRFNNDSNGGFGGSSYKGGFEKKSYNDDRGGFGSSKPRGSGCYKCGEEGHISRDCPSGGDTRKKGCFKCGEEGHMSRECPNNATNDSNGGFGGRGGFNRKDDDTNGFGDDSKPRNSNCFKCSEPGYLARDCPNAESRENAGAPREIYIPPPPPENEDEMFNSLQRGINFNKYDSIPVEASGENCPRPINSFEEAGLTDTIARNVARAKYEKPTPVQKYGIPIINSGRDLMACAQTGSGKTAAFLLPALTTMIRNGLQSSSFSDKQTPQAVIVGPTRELVNQIYLECRKFARNSICRPCVAYGGTSVGHQLGDIQRGCNILIATPGRLMDFIGKGRIGLDHVQFLILDEADRMLDMGFEGEIRKLANSPGMPPKSERQTLMFSATFPDEIQKLAHEFLREDFIFLTVGRVGGACSDVTQNIVQIDQNEKREKLLELLADVSQTRSRTLVFVETKRSADFLACSLSQSGYPTTSIHGDRLQREREEALRDFKRGEHPILIATSVAARGLDIPNVEHVINYDLPKDIDEYVHRIGRTGRCGNLGRATSFYDNSKDSETARCLIRVLSESLQEVPAWLEGCAEGAIGTHFGTDRGGFGGRDARTKDKKSFSKGGGFSSGGRETGDYDYNDGGGFGGSKPSVGGHSGGGGGFGAGDFGDEESWD